MSTPLKPTGFWSYSTLDDQHSHGRLSKLRALLAGELQQAIGRSPVVQLFQDAAAISPGMDWEQSIREAIDDASFLIPIITPGYLQSEWCCTELRLFLERQRALGRNDLVFPIYYQDISDFESIRAGDVHDPEILPLLKTRQWADFRDLRHADVISEKVARRVARLAEDMRRTLYRERRPPPWNDAPAGDAPRGDGPPHPSSGGPGEWFQSLLQAHPSGHWVGRALVAAGLMIVAGVLMGATGFLPHQGQFLAWVGGLLAVAGVGVLVAQYLMPPLNAAMRGDGAAPPPPRSAAARRPLLIGAPPPRPRDEDRKSFLVFFEWDRADLSDQSKETIATAIRLWKQRSGTGRIEVRGYSDTAPSTQRAAEISRERAMAVSVELVRKGVPAGSIAASGQGDSRLLVPTGPDQRERMNRRVEIILPS